jgi:signal transduction histidine kinase
LRVDPSTRHIIAADGRLADRFGPLVGRPLAELWMPSERLAIARRIDDVILSGSDRFGALALSPGDAAVCFVELSAIYDYRGGERLEVLLCEIPDAAPEPLRGPDSGPTVETWRGGGPALALPPARRGGGTSVMQAFQAADVAALEISSDACVLRASSAAERLLSRSSAMLQGLALSELFELPEASEAALAAARADALPQSILAFAIDSAERLVFEWLPADQPGAGFAILSGAGRESPSAERLRFQSQLVSLVAHDVRDAIAAVYCGLHTLSEGLPAESEWRPTVMLALEEIERANRITADVLSISRPGDLKRVELDVDGVVGQTLARYRKRAASASIEIEERLDSGSQILADLSSLERTVANLIENALQATPPGGQLQVSTRHEDRAQAPATGGGEGRAQRGVRISIRDTGVGIKEETRPNVFEPFVTDKQGGTGLGLAIARRVVLDHNGQIHFDTAEGQGTTFHIWLPESDA